MTAPRRRFEVVAPDWGQTHLTSDAVVAFVDDELSPPAHRRAVRHLEGCPACSSDVAVQRQARSALRSARGPELSSSLLHALHAIPRDAELPAPPPGLAVGPDGRFVQALRPLPGGSLPGAPLPAAGAERPSRGRLGAGITVTGLAIGALALTVTVLPSDSPVRGVLGGPVLDTGPATARLQVAPSGQSAQSGQSAAAEQVRPASLPLGRGELAPRLDGAGPSTVADPQADPAAEHVLRRLDVLPAAHPAVR